MVGWLYFHFGRIEELQPLFSILRGEGFRASGVQVGVRGAGPVQHVISRSTVRVPRREASTHTCQHAAV